MILDVIDRCTVYILASQDILLNVNRNSQCLQPNANRSDADLVKANPAFETP